MTAVTTVGLASAGTLVLDNFSTAQGPLTATGSSTVGNRTIAVTLLGGTPPVQHSTEVVSDVLDITNGTGDDSQVVVTWNLASALAIPSGSTNVELTLVVVGSDANPTSINLSGVASGSFSIPGNTSNQTVTFSISGPPVGPGNLVLTIDGQPGWDLTLDSIGLSWTDPVTVPEPSTYAMIGLGLAGLAFLRRK